jgi:hypothetical protein
MIFPKKKRPSTFLHLICCFLFKVERVAGGGIAPPAGKLGFPDKRFVGESLAVFARKNLKKNLNAEKTGDG